MEYHQVLTQIHFTGGAGAVSWLLPITLKESNRIDVRES